MLAHIEAGLDFVDEDIEFVRDAEIDDQLAWPLASVRDILAQLAVRGDSSREPRIVLRGEPNVGKSSLLNALVRTEAAIVSPLAGTTRDYVSRPFHWHDVAGVLVDTPGYEEASPDDPLAQRRPTGGGPASPAGAPGNPLSRCHATAQRAGTPGADRGRAGRAHRGVDQSGSRDRPRGDVRTRCSRAASPAKGSTRCDRSWPAASAGVRRPIVGAVASTAVRCRESLHDAAARLQSARRLVAQRGGEELVAVELRDALDQLGQVVGAVYTDDILDRIFSRFCIGK